MRCCVVGVMQGVVMNRPAMFLGMMRAGEWMMFRANFAAMSLEVSMMPVMGMMGGTTAFPSHRGTSAAADVAAALVALVSLAQHVLVALNHLFGTAEFQVLLVGFVVVRVMLDRGVFRDLAALRMMDLPMKETLVPCSHVFSPLRALSRRDPK
jgi:hypothetical protein